jgi:hypothetical protein
MFGLRQILFLVADVGATIGEFRSGRAVQSECVESWVRIGIDLGGTKIEAIALADSPTSAAPRSYGIVSPRPSETTLAS